MGIAQNNLEADASQVNGFECIILAGGLGTRLRGAVPDLPKCMAPIAGKPFLQFLIDYLIKEGVTHFIFSLGYMHEVIESFLATTYPALNFQCSIEDSPLGTGGAIKKACALSTQKNIMILNGDTMFAINVQAFMAFHQQQQAHCTLSLKPMENFERYGVVKISSDNRIESFEEKKYYQNGLINGGIYALQVTSFLSLPFPDRFSFESEYLEQYVGTKKIMGWVEETYFIDIGIPEDYAKAGIELPTLL